MEESILLKKPYTPPALFPLQEEEPEGGSDAGVEPGGFLLS